MSEVRNLIGRLEKLRDELLHPLAFYAAHRDDWEELARRVARTVLINLRPLEAQGEAWQRQIDTSVAYIAARLVTADDAGIAITLAALPEEASELPDDPRFFSSQGLTVEEVIRWVAAGRSGEDNLGKRLDQRDEGKTDRQIAWRILYALKLNKAGATDLRIAIERFLGRELGQQAEGIYPEILRAWAEVFAVRAVEDYRGWVHGRIAAHVH